MILRQPHPEAATLSQTSPRSPATSSALTDDALLVAVMDAADGQLALRQSEGVSDLYAPLLRVLTCSYATGIYSSEEVEALVLENPTLRWLAGGRQPTAASLRAFRRRNREALAQCLVEVLERLPAPRTASGCRALGRAPSGYLAHSLGRWQPPAAQPDPLAEAERRIARAVRFDSGELDI